MSKREGPAGEMLHPPAGHPTGDELKGDGHMASIRKETTIAAHPDEVWSALRDWGALHERLVPGFAVATEIEGGDRIVTFFNGAVARERLVDLDEKARQLVWSIVDGPYAHHNGAAQVHGNEDGTTRFVWVADLLPDELAEPTEQLMERGIATVKTTLEDRTAK
jgi:carbon monoxide dehydrogenase subunit G